MNKKIKLIVSIAIAIIIGYFGYDIIYVMIYVHHFDNSNYKACLWIFSDSVQKDIDTTAVCGSVRKTDKIYTYIYKHHYFISIWEIKALHDVDINKIVIKKNIMLGHVKLKPGEILDVGSGIETQVKFGPFLKDTIVIDLDNNSKSIRTFEKANYRGFYGSVSRMAFENGEGEIIALEEYTREFIPTLFLMYKANNSFYTITIHSDKPFDENIINILNLK